MDYKLFGIKWKMTKYASKKNPTTIVKLDKN